MFFSNARSHACVGPRTKCECSYASLWQIRNTKGEKIIRDRSRSSDFSRAEHSLISMAMAMAMVFQFRRAQKGK